MEGIKDKSVRETERERERERKESSSILFVDYNFLHNRKNK